MLSVNSIYYTVSGEGKTAGMPCTIVRLAGCNLHYNGKTCCKWCDTPQAQKDNDGARMTEEDIIDRVFAVSKNKEVPLVLLTGGEPLHQNIRKLLIALKQHSKVVELETNGSISLGVLGDKIGLVACATVDMKPPSSGASEYMIKENLYRLSAKDQVKFVISEESDFKWALETLHAYKTSAKVLFSPAWKGKVRPHEVASMILEQYPKGRLSLQLHKWVDMP